MVRTPSVSIVVISGQIGAGKTSTAQALARAGAATLVSARDALRSLVGGPIDDRRHLQVEGAALERRTNGRWLLEYMLARAETAPRLVLDSGRTRLQVEPILETHPDARLVYLAANAEVRRHRFEVARASDPVKRSLSFDEAMRHQTESESGTLAAMAHWVIETDGMVVADVVREIVELVGWNLNG